MATKKKNQKKTKKMGAKVCSKAPHKPVKRAARGPMRVEGRALNAAPDEREAGKIKSPLSKKELAAYREKLQALRDRVIDEIGFLTGDNLNRSQRDSAGDLSTYSMHMADHGTDNFDREFALNLASSEQDTLYEIDEALARIEMNTFGVCEMCGCAIEKARLQAMPYARMCIKCKTQTEKGKARYRPFGPTLSQTIPSE
jgi:DnaK suppressor protein